MAAVEVKDCVGNGIAVIGGIFLQEREKKEIPSIEQEMSESLEYVPNSRTVEAGYSGATKLRLLRQTGIA